MRLMFVLLLFLCTACSDSPHGSLPETGFDTYSFGFARGAAENFRGNATSDPEVAELALYLTDAGWLSLGLGTDWQTRDKLLKLQDATATSSWVNPYALQFLQTSVILPSEGESPWRGTVEVNGDVATVNLAMSLTFPEDQAERLTDVQMVGTLSKAAIDEAVASIADVGYGETLRAGEIASHWTLTGTYEGTPFELEFDQPLTCMASHGRSTDLRAD